MIIGSEFSNKSRNLLREIGRLTEHLDGRGYVEIATIGGPLLYGHVTITGTGLENTMRYTESNGKASLILRVILARIALHAPFNSRPDTIRPPAVPGVLFYQKLPTFGTKLNQR